MEYSKSPDSAAVKFPKIAVKENHSKGTRAAMELKRFQEIFDTIKEKGAKRAKMRNSRPLKDLITEANKTTGFYSGLLKKLEGKSKAHVRYITELDARSNIQLKQQ